MMAASLPRPVAGLLLLGAGIALAGEPTTEGADDGRDPPAEEAEADRRGPPAEALPGPRLSDRPFRPEGPESSEEDRSTGRDCCDMEH